MDIMMMKLTSYKLSIFRVKLDFHSLKGVVFMYVNFICYALVGFIDQKC